MPSTYCVRSTQLRRDLFAIAKFLCFVFLKYFSRGFYCSVLLEITRGQSNLTKSASRGAHSPVRGHPGGSKVVPLNSWGRVSY